MYNTKDGGVTMERITNAFYTKELREEAVKLVTEGRFNIPAAGRFFIDCPINDLVLGQGEQGR